MSLSPELSPLSPNKVVRLDDVTSLHSFEDVVEQHLAFPLSAEERQFWEMRTKLRDELRPLKFNGSIANIYLQVMENPAEKLESARERGFSFNRGAGNVQQISRFISSENAGEAIGFTYIADANSSGRGSIGQVQAELWYHPDSRTPWTFQNKVRRSGIQRIVTRAHIESENFVALDDDSKYIALSALSSAIARAKPNGFQN